MQRLLYIIGLFAIVAFAGFGLASVASAEKTIVQSNKVTICHAAGLADTTHYVTLTIGYPAVYGPAGHFYENGTAQAGHEQDYLGPCRGDETTTTTTTETTETTTTTTTTPPCIPRNPDGSPGGKDGKPGNDDCAADETTTTVVTTTPEPPPTTTTEPAPTTTEPPATETEPDITTTVSDNPPSITNPDKEPRKAPDKNKPKPTATGDEGTLPYTGLPLLLVAILGGVLSLAGLELRRR